jgi:hypothetical protein
MKGENGLSEEQIRFAIDQLSKEELNFLQNIFDVIDSLRPEIAELQKEVTGLDPVWLGPTPIVTKHGTFKGGYYPMIYDPFLSTQGEMQLGATIGNLTEAGYEKATTPRSHLHERIEEFAAPVSLNIDFLLPHMAGVIKDLTHRKWLIDAKWFIENPRIRAEISSRLGPEFITMINDWIKRQVNTRSFGHMQSLKRFQKLVEGAANNFTVAVLGFKSLTLIKQFTGIPNAIEMIGGKQGQLSGTRWFSYGYKEFVTNPIQSFKNIFDESGVMRHRITTRDRDLRRLWNSLIGKTGLLNEAKKFSVQLIGYVELMVSGPAWMGAKAKGLSTGLTNRQAIHFADSVVELSQGASMEKDMSAIMSRTDLLARAVTMFHTPFSSMYSRYRNVVHQQRRLKDIPLTAGRVFMLWLVMYTMESLLGGKLPDPDDDEDTWAKWAIQNVAIGPTSSVPILRDISGPATSSIMGTKSFRYRVTPLQDIVDTTLRTLSGTKKVIEGDKEIEEMLGLYYKNAAYLFGIPGGTQVDIMADNFSKLSTGEADPPESLGDFYEFLNTRRGTR